MRYFILISVIIFIHACTGKKQDDKGHEAAEVSADRPVLDIEQANRLAELPIACVEQEYPNKLNQTLSGDADLLPPRDLHPSFYGCFDWHSSVHGHWSMLMLLKQFEGLDRSEEMITILQRQRKEQS